MRAISEDSILSAAERQRFNEIYRKFGEGDRAQALTALRSLRKEVQHPWAKIALLYHEALFLLELDGTSEARDRLEEFKKALGSQALPQDRDDGDIRNSLPVMALYAELRVLYKEGKKQAALQTVEELKFTYSKQLSSVGFEEISQDIAALHGMLLADAGRCNEATPLLETASQHQSWESSILYYLGHCYHELRRYKPAKEKMLQALDAGIPPEWTCGAHQILGRTDYYLGEMQSAKRHFELFLKSADKSRVVATRTLEWLEKTCLALGQYDEAEKYHNLALGYTNKHRPN